LYDSDERDTPVISSSIIISVAALQAEATRVEWDDAKMTGNTHDPCATAGIAVLSAGRKGELEATLC